MRLIGIAGKARSGKDAVANYLKVRYGFGVYSFAEPIREATKAILMLSEEFLENNKERQLDWVDTSYRDFAQRLGTDFVRSMVDQDFWIKRAQHVLDTTSYDSIVIPDVRFENEVEWVRSVGGAVWHIERLDAQVVKSHVSEDGVTKLEEEVFLRNNGSVKELYDNVKEVIDG